MSTLLTGSLCLTDLMEQAKKGHSAFSRSAKNQKVYINFTQWINDKPNEFGHDASFTLNSTKEKRDEELAANADKKIYFGNAKVQEKKEGGGGEPVAAGAPDLSLGDLPF